MTLPDDFGTKLSQIEKFGFLVEDAERIHKRVNDALIGVASVEAPTNLGAGDWATNVLNNLKEGIHREICDTQHGRLKDAYGELLDKALTQEGITAVAVVVGNVIASVNPACFVTSVILYLTIWLLKVGLNEWCALPDEARS